MESLLAREAMETPARARVQIATIGPQLAELARRLAARPPAVIATCARGSSDHAATYGAYLLATTLGRVVASVGPSVAPSFERVAIDRRDTLLVAVSQSGRSPDLVRLAEAARRDGALVVGLVNTPASPLADACELVIPLCAGEERAIAATKSHLLAELAFLQLAAAWSGSAELADAVARAPDALAAVTAAELAGLASAPSLFVLGRGLALGAAQEIALKLKETCRLHAEAFSTAEVRHGPMALVGPGFHVVALDDDPALAQLGAVIQPVTSSAGHVLAPLCQTQACYLALPALARLRGLDADAPRHIQKITETR